jgi:hypothetical protein
MVVEREGVRFLVVKMASKSLNSARLLHEFLLARRRQYVKGSEKRWGPKSRSREVANHSMLDIKPVLRVALAMSSTCSRSCPFQSLFHAMAALRTRSIATATAKTTNFQTLVLCNHCCQDLENIFRYSIVVDAD